MPYAMSTNEQVINFAFRSTNQMGATLLAVQSGLNSLTAVAGSVGRGLSDAMSTAQSGALALGTMTLMAMGQAIGAATEYQAKMAQVKAISGQSTEEVNNLGNSAQQLSMKYGMSLNDVTDGLITLGRAGIDNATVQTGVLEEGFKMAKLEGMSLNDALEDLVTTTNLLNNNGVDMNSEEYTGQVQEMNTKLLTASQVAPIDVKNVIDSLQYAGGAAAVSNMDQDNLLATISALGARGTKGAMAGTALRNFMTRSITSTGENALESIGLSGDSLWKFGGDKMRSFSDMKRMLDETMEDRGMTTQDQLGFWAKFAGPKMANQLMKIDPDQVEQYEEKISEGADINEQMNTILTSTKETWNEIISAVTNFMVNVGSKFLTIINPVVQAFRTILGLFSGNSLLSELFGWITSGVMVSLLVGGASALFNLLMPSLASLHKKGLGLKGVVQDIGGEVLKTKKTWESIKNPKSLEKKARAYNETELENIRYFTAKTEMPSRMADPFKMREFQNLSTLQQSLMYNKKGMPDLKDTKSLLNEGLLRELIGDDEFSYSKYGGKEGYIKKLDEFVNKDDKNNIKTKKEPSSTNKAEDKKQQHQDSNENKKAIENSTTEAKKTTAAVSTLDKKITEQNQQQTKAIDSVKASIVSLKNSDNNTKSINIDSTGIITSIGAVSTSVSGIGTQLTTHFNDITKLIGEIKTTLTSFSVKTNNSSGKGSRINSVLDSLNIPKESRQLDGTLRERLKMALNTRYKDTNAGNDFYKQTEGITQVKVIKEIFTDIDQSNGGTFTGLPEHKQKKFLEGKTNSDKEMQDLEQYNIDKDSNYNNIQSSEYKGGLSDRTIQKLAISKTNAQYGILGDTEAKSILQDVESDLRKVEGEKTKALKSEVSRIEGEKNLSKNKIHNLKSGSSNAKEYKDNQDAIEKLKTQKQDFQNKIDNNTGAVEPFDMILMEPNNYQKPKKEKKKLTKSEHKKKFSEFLEISAPVDNTKEITNIDNRISILETELSELGSLSTSKQNPNTKEIKELEERNKTLSEKTGKNKDLALKTIKANSPEEKEYQQIQLEKAFAKDNYWIAYGGFKNWLGALHKHGAASFDEITHDMTKQNLLAPYEGFDIDSDLYETPDDKRFQKYLPGIEFYGDKDDMKYINQYKKASGKKKDDLRDNIWNYTSITGEGAPLSDKIFEDYVSTGYLYFEDEHEREKKSLQKDNKYYNERDKDGNRKCVVDSDEFLVENDADAISLIEENNKFMKEEQDSFNEMVKEHAETLKPYKDIKKKENDFLSKNAVRGQKKQMKDEIVENTNKITELTNTLEQNDKQIRDKRNSITELKKTKKQLQPPTKTAINKTLKDINVSHLTDALLNSEDSDLNAIKNPSDIQKERHQMVKEEITKRKNKQNYTLKERNFSDLSIKDVEDAINLAESRKEKHPNTTYAKSLDAYIQQLQQIKEYKQNNTPVDYDKEINLLQEKNDKILNIAGNNAYKERLIQAKQNLEKQQTSITDRINNKINKLGINNLDSTNISNKDKFETIQGHNIIDVEATTVSKKEEPTTPIKKETQNSLQIAQAIMKKNTTENIKNTKSQGMAYNDLSNDVKYLIERIKLLDTEIVNLPSGKQRNKLIADRDISMQKLQNLQPNIKYIPQKEYSISNTDTKQDIQNGIKSLDDIKAYGNNITYGLKSLKENENPYLLKRSEYSLQFGHDLPVTRSLTKGFKFLSNFVNDAKSLQNAQAHKITNLSLNGGPYVEETNSILKERISKMVGHKMSGVDMPIDKEDYYYRGGHKIYRGTVENENITKTIADANQKFIKSITLDDIKKGYTDAAGHINKTTQAKDSRYNTNGFNLPKDIDQIYADRAIKEGIDDIHQKSKKAGSEFAKPFWDRYHKAQHEKIQGYHGVGGMWGRGADNAQATGQAYWGMAKAGFHTAKDTISVAGNKAMTESAQRARGAISNLGQQMGMLAGSISPQLSAALMTGSIVMDVASSATELLTVARAGEATLLGILNIELLAFIAPILIIIGVILAWKNAHDAEAKAAKEKVEETGKEYDKHQKKYEYYTKQVNKNRDKYFDKLQKEKALLEQTANAYQYAGQREINTEKDDVWGGLGFAGTIARRLGISNDDDIKKRSKDTTSEITEMVDKDNQSNLTGNLAADLMGMPMRAAGIQPKNMQLQSDITGYYNQHEQQFQEMNQYKSELSTLYNLQNSLMGTGLTATQAQNSAKFQEALQGVTQKTGMSAKKIKSYLQWMQGEQFIKASKEKMGSDADYDKNYMASTTTALWTGQTFDDLENLKGMNDTQKKMLEVQALQYGSEVASEAGWALIKLYILQGVTFLEWIFLHLSGTDGNGEIGKNEKKQGSIQGAINKMQGLTDSNTNAETYLNAVDTSSQRTDLESGESADSTNSSINTVNKPSWSGLGTSGSSSSSYSSSTLTSGSSSTGSSSSGSSSTGSSSTTVTPTAVSADTTSTSLEQKKFVITGDWYINTTGDPDDIKSQMMQIFEDISERINPKVVSQTSGTPPTTTANSSTGDANTDSTSGIQDGVTPATGDEKASRSNYAKVLSNDGTNVVLGTHDGKKIIRKISDYSFLKNSKKDNEYSYSKLNVN